MNLTALFLTVTAAYGLPPGLLGSLCYVESKWKPSAIHHDDGGGASKGICQVKDITRDFVGIKGDLMDPTVNVKAAAAYLKYQLRRYHGNIAKAVTAYNQGSVYGDGNSAYFRKVRARWNRSCDQKRCTLPGRSH